MVLIQLWNDSFDINEFRNKLSGVNFSDDDWSRFVEYITNSGFNIDEIAVNKN
jgi:hypothetical protein